jgi:CTP:molybdopterin cytidylyltransferase MocA
LPVGVLIVAAGSGSRFGGAKQFAQLGGRSLVEHAVMAARSKKKRKKKKKKIKKTK